MRPVGAAGKIGFLHTATVHSPVFDHLVALQTPDVSVVHRVRPDLLARAREEGLSARVEREFSQSVLELRDEGCTAVSCTCSTLGPLAEQLDIDGLSLHRIDRAAADQCMEYRSVLVIVALASAGESAGQLLDQSRASLAAMTSWRVMTVPGAWLLFESGDLAGYRRLVADFCNVAGVGYDAVFLAQASMLGAEAQCDHPVVLTSPAAGVRRLLESRSNPTTD